MSTVLGFLAILFWSTSVALTRSLAEQVGTITADAAIFLLSGLLGCACLALTGWRPRNFLALPRPYVIGCGALFVSCCLSLYLAIGFARNRQQVLVVGVINYLWPALALVFSLPVLRKKAKLTLLPGAVIALAGAFLAMAQGGSFSWHAFASDVRGAWAPYVLALVAAITWGLYSNYARKWGGKAGGGAVPVFLLATGLMFAALRPAFAEQSHWHFRGLLELLFIATVPLLLAYIFWDVAMRKGRMILVVSFSYLIPLLSTLVTYLYLGVPPGASVWIACLLVIGGAFICWHSVETA